MEDFLFPPSMPGYLPDHLPDHLPAHRVPFKPIRRPVARLPQPDLVSLDDYERAARRALVPQVFDTYAQGSEDEVTLRANRAAYASIQLRPRVLVDVSACDTATQVLGTPVRTPVLIAPTSVHQLAHPTGESATARAAHAAQTVMIASTLSSEPLEAIAAAADGGPLWFQLYVYRDLALTRQLLRRVQAAGYRAIVLTVDGVRIGNRERDRRHHFALPPHIQFANFASAEQDADRNPAHGPITWQSRGERAPMTWETIGWLRSLTSLPILLKGILTAEDAELAVTHGVDGVIVSNHGGRQLDGVAPTIAVLPEVVAAVNGRCEVYVDGGIRRGTDVLKALSLGARAVLTGRPVLWGLAVNGEAGVRAVLDILHDELALAMALAGCPTVAHITRSLVRLP